MAQWQITAVKDALGNTVPVVGGLLNVPQGTYHVYFRVWDLPVNSTLETVLAAVAAPNTLPSNPNIADQESECSRDTVNHPPESGVDWWQYWYATFQNDNPEGQDVNMEFRLWPKYTKLDGHHSQTVRHLMMQA